MRYAHVAYIDEAGDEGFGKLRQEKRGGQSQWLILGAVVVRGTDDLLLPSWRDEIFARFPNTKQRDLHFRNLRHEQKVVVAQELASRPIRTCLTFSNKETIPGSRWAETFKRPGYLYNYLTRWLLERVTTFCRYDANKQGLKGRLKVIFSRRGGTNYQAMHDYMVLMRDGREKFPPVRSIDWSVFSPDDIIVENHSKWAGLQLADAVTSAFFSAVEPNMYGNFETRYADILRPTVICREGKTLNAGITPVPSLEACRASDAQLAFFRSFAQKKRVPGP